MSELLSVCPVEIPLWQKTDYLTENVLTEMHIYTKFDLAAKVRISKVRQGFRRLLYCAWKVIFQFNGI